MKRIYIPLLMALALTACEDANNEHLAPMYDGVMRFDITTGVQTKVAAGAFEADDRIGLYVTDYASDATPMPLQISGNRANNVVVNFDGSLWTPEETIYWGSGKSDVYAYYPYFEAISDVNNLYFELAADQDGIGYEASDLLWAKAEGIAQSGGPVNLLMKHLMSKLTVKLVAGEDYIGSLPKDATIHLHSTVSNARVDLENGSVFKDSYSGAKSIKMRNLGIKTCNGVEAVVYEAIVVPQMLEYSVPLLEINSESVSYLLEDSFNFRPGVAYTYTVTLNTSTTAIKVEIGCKIEDWNNPEGGDLGEGGEDGSGEGDSGDVGDDAMVYTDLSAAGTANCYIVRQSGNYKFKAVVGNTDATVGNVKTVEVLWESFGTDEMPDVGDIIASASYKNGYVRFSTPENFRDGNAVIAARNSKGITLWSWHIWCAEEGWEEQVYDNNAGTMMDRNLGATSATPGDVGALGLLYQWGRKDPFLHSSSISSYVQALSTGGWEIVNSGSENDAELNPMTFYKSLQSHEMCWMLQKGVYDPCPYGWHVPRGDEAGIWCVSGLGDAMFDTTHQGWLYRMEDSGMDVWYPAAGFRDCYNDTDIWGIGNAASYWSCSRTNITNNYRYSAFGLYFGIDESVASYVYDLDYGCSVRCQKEEWL